MQVFANVNLFNFTYEGFWFPMSLLVLNYNIYSVKPSCPVVLAISQGALPTIIYFLSSIPSHWRNPSIFPCPTL